MFQNVEVEQERVDQRSVDDLLTFINGGNGGMIQKSLAIVLIVNCFLLFFHILNFLELLSYLYELDIMFGGVISR